jgi:hypothetical protein
MKVEMYLRKMMYHMLGAGVLCFAFAFAANAQVETTKSSKEIATPVTSVKVERGTVVYVNGNNVVVKAEDGSLRHFDNVPESVTVTVDGKQLNVHQLQPGMQVERQTITTTVPKLITTVKTVTGVVWFVNPPSTVILRLANNTNQSFKIPDGQKFKIAGQDKEVDAWGLKKGMRIDAQQVTEQTQTEVEQQVKRTGVMPPPPPAPAPNVAILIIAARPTPAPVETASAAPAEAEPAPTALPKTASDLPLVGLLGAFLFALGMGLKAVRTRNA